MYIHLVTIPKLQFVDAYDVISCVMWFWLQYVSDIVGECEGYFRSCVFEYFYDHSYLVASVYGMKGTHFFLLLFTCLAVLPPTPCHW